MSLSEHLLFVAFVAIASYVQNLTGFAFGLVLLGLVGLVNLAPLPDVTNVVSILALLNGILLLQKGLPRFDRGTIVPTLSASLVGVFLGVMLLNWLSDNVVLGLRLLLGVTIVACAILLLVNAPPLAHRSPASRFAVIGLLSGVLGGLFSTAGPPLAYHYYRQPMKTHQVRDALTIAFAVNAVVRLTLLTGTGRIGANSLWMSLEAAPVVLVLTWMAFRRPSRWSALAIKRIVSVLLGAVGLALFVSAVRQLAGPLSDG